MCCKVDTFLLPRKLVAYCLQMKCTDIIFEGEAKEREREKKEKEKKTTTRSRQNVQKGTQNNKENMKT